jgi:hypothetical protein
MGRTTVAQDMVTAIRTELKSPTGRITLNAQCELEAYYGPTENRTLCDFIRASDSDTTPSFKVSVDPTLCQ